MIPKKTTVFILILFSAILLLNIFAAAMAQDNLIPPPDKETRMEEGKEGPRSALWVLLIAVFLWLALSFIHRSEEPKKLDQNNAVADIGSDLFDDWSSGGDGSGDRDD